MISHPKSVSTEHHPVNLVTNELNLTIQFESFVQLQ